MVIKAWVFPYDTILELNNILYGNYHKKKGFSLFIYLFIYITIYLFKFLNVFIFLAMLCGWHDLIPQLGGLSLSRGSGTARS